MLNSIKAGGRAWAQSFGVLVDSSIYVFVLTAIVCLWCLAGYGWLSLPKTSGWVLALVVPVPLALAVLGLILLAGCVESISLAASGTERSLRLRRLYCFDKGRLGRALQIVLAGLLLLLALRALFGWLDAHTLTLVSVLTFHHRHPVSQVPIAKTVWVIEALISIFSAGFAMTWLLVLSNPAQPKTPRGVPGTLARSVGLSVFLTGLLSTAVFGGLAWRLAISQPVYKAAGWDVAKFVICNGAAFLLLTLGWLFWALALACLTLAPLTKSGGAPLAS
jgi:hypothetical protein